MIGCDNIEVLDNHLKVGYFMIGAHFLFNILCHLLLVYFTLFVFASKAFVFCFAKKVYFYLCVVCLHECVP